MKTKIIEANEVGSLNEDQILAMNSALENIARNDFVYKKIYEEIKELGFYYIRSKGLFIIAIRKTKLQL